MTLPESKMVELDLSNASLDGLQTLGSSVCVWRDHLKGWERLFLLMCVMANLCACKRERWRGVVVLFGRVKGVDRRREGEVLQGKGCVESERFLNPVCVERVVCGDRGSPGSPREKENFVCNILFLRFFWEGDKDQKVEVAGITLLTLHAILQGIPALFVSVISFARLPMTLGVLTARDFEA
ncbi:putative ATP binding protein [Corchorus olitorius]|uniref:ATP binding protein n=1 Tax=Corchorus olitorius TaxID=93759 RepID=A0A1R3ITV0_9ROSI|nr:putative ATP binding protein [Corchorus olitorius]